MVLHITAVGHSQLLAWWPGNLSRISSGIPQTVQTVLGAYLKHTHLRDTRASSALGVPNNNALYKPTHSLTNYTKPFQQSVTLNGKTTSDSLHKLYRASQAAEAIGPVGCGPSTFWPLWANRISAHPLLSPILNITYYMYISAVL